VKRIGLLVGFWMLCAAVQAPGRALEILDEETSRDSGALDLYCNGNKLARRYIRKHLRLDLAPPGLARILYHVGFFPAGPLGWQEPWNAYRFELVADQMRRLIRRKRLRPKQRPGPKAEYRKLISQAMRSREAQRLQHIEDLLAYVERKAGEKGITLPKRKQTIIAEIQKRHVRN
jgi:hypothetical protein